MAFEKIPGTDAYRFVGADGKTRDAEPVATVPVDAATGNAGTLLPPGQADETASVPVVASIQDRRSARANRNFRLLSSAATTNLTGGATTPVSLATARAIHNVRGRKATANSAWLKLYDKATAPVVASDVPFASIELVANATFDLDMKGYPLVNGLAFAITGASGDTDATAVAAGDVLGLNILFAT